MSRTLPILCAGSVVRNILRGAQTQDRRPIKALAPLADGSPSYPQYHLRELEADHRGALLHIHNGDGAGAWFAAPWSPGDVLYVRETWSLSVSGAPLYAAENYGLTPHPGPWKPSIHMRKEHARIHLRVLSVGVERVNAISKEDARAEGCASVAEFAALWDGLYGAGSMEAGAWCWVTKFERVAP